MEKKPSIVEDSPGYLNYEISEEEKGEYNYTPVTNPYDEVITDPFNTV